MKEFLDFTTLTDLGGTFYDYVKEETKDRVTYFARDRSSLTKLEIPGERSFIHVSVENLDGGIFSEVYYDFMGELTSANIWLARYLDQNHFIERFDPSDSLLTTYDELHEARTDILFEVELPLQQVGLYHCLDDSTADYLSALSCSIHGTPSGTTFIKFPLPGSGITPVTFRAIVEPEVISLGFRVNEENIVHDKFSTSVKFDALFGKKVTPGAVRSILEDVFVKY